ncbi:MAG: hypothetical protein ACXVGO_00725 [Mycobacterium sp.]
MTTIAFRGLAMLVAAPVAVAGIIAATLGLPAVAHASVTPGVNARTSRMVLSREYVAQQEHGAATTPLDKQQQDEEAQADSPAKQEHSELRGDLKAAEVKEGAVKTVESLANVQPAEPKAHVYAVKAPVHKRVGLMHAGFSQVAR